jgi:WD40 repeat protein
LPVNDLAFFPYGQYLPSCSGDETVRIWDIGAKKQIAQFAGDKDFLISSLAYSPDGRLIAAVSKQVHIWNTATQAEVAAIPNNEQFGFKIGFTSNQELIAWSAAESKLRVWDVRTGRRLFHQDNKQLSSRLRASGRPLIQCGPRWRLQEWKSE